MVAIDPTFFNHGGVGGRAADLTGLAAVVGREPEASRWEPGIFLPI